MGFFKNKVKKTKQVTVLDQCFALKEPSAFELNEYWAHYDSELSKIDNDESTNFDMSRFNLKMETLLIALCVKDSVSIDDIPEGELTQEAIAAEILSDVTDYQKEVTPLYHAAWELCGLKKQNVDSQEETSNKD